MNQYAHEYEEKFAEILDAFNIEYQYEPITFVIHQNGNGDIKKGFTPDFYLPEIDLYVEITSMHGNSCNKKNRKINDIKQLHNVDTVLLKKPKINKIFWRFGKGYLTREIVLDMLTFNGEHADNVAEPAGV
jgi:hypoxanthine phosphoribosyltransferase